MKMTKFKENGMKTFTIFSIPLIILALTVLPAHAGWVATTQEDVSYYGNGVLKQVPSSQEGGPESIMNFTKGTVTMLNHDSRTYTTFKFEEFCQFIKKMYSGAGPEMLAMIKQMNEAKPKPNVKISRIGKGETIAGFATTKYKVMNNGQMERTVWMAEDGRLKKYNSSYFDKAMASIKKMSQCDDIGMSGQTVDTSSAYLNLMKSGWLMKEDVVNEDEMSGSSPPVEKLVEKNLPGSTFSIPQGYKKVPLEQFNMGG